jgi:hypothetical protein
VIRASRRLRLACRALARGRTLALRSHGPHERRPEPRDRLVVERVLARTAADAISTEEAVHQVNCQNWQNCQECQNRSFSLLLALFEILALLAFDPFSPYGDDDDLRLDIVDAEVL